jgi:hypothetical protein
VGLEFRHKIHIHTPSVHWNYQPLGSGFEGELEMELDRIINTLICGHISQAQNAPTPTDITSARGTGTTGLVSARWNGHFYVIFNLEVGENLCHFQFQSLWGRGGLDAFVHTLMLVFRYPKFMQEEISTLASLTKDLQLEGDLWAQRVWVREGSLMCSKTGCTVFKTRRLSLVPNLPRCVLEDI